MLLHILRAIFVLIVAAVAMSFIASDVDPSSPLRILQVYKHWVLLGVILVALGVIVLDVFVVQKSLLAISGLFFGLVVGMVMAFGISLVIDLVVQSMFPELRVPVQAEVVTRGTIPVFDPQTGTTRMVEAQMPGKEVVAYRDHPFISTIKIIVGVICCYLAVSFIYQTKDDVRFVIPYVEFSKQTKGARPMLLDTSVIIDGRIADICETRIVESTLIVPRFVLQELQWIADSPDKLKRNRGRRGLDVLNRMQLNENIDIQIRDVQLQRGDEKRTVDEMLVELGSQINGRVVTNDYNLNKVAQLRGVTVININDLANALKPVFLPGEQLQVKILKPGEEPGQGVGYLEDGTMVVVEAARDQIGRTVDIAVTSVLQTSAGRMIFGRNAAGQGGSKHRTADTRREGTESKESQA